jgi:hypothetical protein
MKNYENYKNLITKVVKEKIGKEGIGSKIGDEIECLALWYITNGRFPSYYTAIHVYNGYLDGKWCDGIRERKVKTDFDEVLNDKIIFPIWISFADTFRGARERIFVFGKKNQAFKKALEETAKEFETKHLSFKELYNYMMKHPTKGLSGSWRKIILSDHPLDTDHLDLLGEIEKTKEVVLVGAVYKNVDNKYQKWGL